ncbi:hypothetical protein D1872_248030 [compost metagenome]
MKNVFSKILLTATLIPALILPSSAFASEGDEYFDLTSPEVIAELKQAEIDTAEAKAKAEKDNEEERKQGLEKLKKDDPEAYKEVTSKQSLALASTGQMGVTGDILITYDNKHSGWEHGHAAIVRQDKNYIVEAMPSDGVRNYQNNWGVRCDTKKKMYVNGATAAKKTAAQAYAAGKIGTKYSLLSTKSSTSSYYCSQLVWQAWNEQGFDLDSNGGFIVTPAELERDFNTIVY